MPRVLEVIESDVTRGCGGVCRQPHAHEIVRTVKQYWTLDGEFLAEHDSVPPERRAIGAIDDYLP